MTNAEIIWLANRLPKATVSCLEKEIEQATEFWGGVPIPGACALAVQVVAIEVALIMIGGLEMLNRPPSNVSRSRS